MKIKLLLFMIILTNFPFCQSVNYIITNYDAIADGKTNNAVAIQKAVDECADNGGGTVYIPAGEFLTGVLQLKSNITLYLENGAVLKGSPNLNDYVLNGVRVGLIFTKDCENVIIKGDGIIDLNGDKFNYMDKRKIFKPDEYKKYTRQGMNYASESTEVSDGPAEPQAATRPIRDSARRDLRTIVNMWHRTNKGPIRR